MARLKTIEAFKKMKADTVAAIGVRKKTSTTITVGMGTCGIAAGARQTLQAIMAELQRCDIDAHVAITGCMGKCGHEPLVTVTQAGGDQMIYGPITAEMVPRLVEEHLINGRVVEPWAVGRLPDTAPDHRPENKDPHALHDKHQA